MLPEGHDSGSAQQAPARLSAGPATKEDPGQNGVPAPRGSTPKANLATVATASQGYQLVLALQTGAKEMLSLVLCSLQTVPTDVLAT